MERWVHDKLRDCRHAMEQVWERNERRAAQVGAERSFITVCIYECKALWTQLLEEIPEKQNVTIGCIPEKEYENLQKLCATLRTKVREQNETAYTVMEVLKGRIAKQESTMDKIHKQLYDEIIALREELFKKQREHHDKVVDVGFRPEHFSLMDYVHFADDSLREAANVMADALRDQLTHSNKALEMQKERELAGGRRSRIEAELQQKMRKTQEEHQEEVRQLRIEVDTLRSQLTLREQEAKARLEAEVQRLKDIHSQELVLQEGEAQEDSPRARAGPPQDPAASDQVVVTSAEPGGDAAAKPDVPRPAAYADFTLPADVNRVLDGARKEVNAIHEQYRVRFKTIQLEWETELLALSRHFREEVEAATQKNEELAQELQRMQAENAKLKVTTVRQDQHAASATEQLRQRDRELDTLRPLNASLTTENEELLRKYQEAHSQLSKLLEKDKKGAKGKATAEGLQATAAVQHKGKGSKVAEGKDAEVAQDAQSQGVRAHPAPSADFAGRKSPAALSVSVHEEAASAELGSSASPPGPPRLGTADELGVLSPPASDRDGATSPIPAGRRGSRRTSLAPRRFSRRNTAKDLSSPPSEPAGSPPVGRRVSSTVPPRPATSEAGCQAEPDDSPKQQLDQLREELRTMKRRLEEATVWIEDAVLVAPLTDAQGQEHGKDTRCRILDRGDARSEDPRAVLKLQSGAIVKDVPLTAFRRLKGADVLSLRRTEWQTERDELVKAKSELQDELNVALGDVLSAEAEVCAQREAKQALEDKVEELQKENTELRQRIKDLEEDLLEKTEKILQTGRDEEKEFAELRGQIETALDAAAAARDAEREAKRAAQADKVEIEQLKESLAASEARLAKHSESALAALMLQTTENQATDVEGLMETEDRETQTDGTGAPQQFCAKVQTPSHWADEGGGLERRRSSVTRRSSRTGSPGPSDRRASAAADSPMVTMLVRNSPEVPPGGGLDRRSSASKAADLPPRPISGRTTSTRRVTISPADPHVQPARVPERLPAQPRRGSAASATSAPAGGEEEAAGLSRRPTTMSSSPSLPPGDPRGSCKSSEATIPGELAEPPEEPRLLGPGGGDPFADPGVMLHSPTPPTAPAEHRPPRRSSAGDVSRRPGGSAGQRSTASMGGEGGKAAAAAGATMTVTSLNTQSKVPSPRRQSLPTPAVLAPHARTTAPQDGRTQGGVAVVNMPLEDLPELQSKEARAQGQGWARQQHVQRKKREIFGRQQDQAPDAFWEEEIVEEVVAPSARSPDADALDSRRRSSAYGEKVRRGSQFYRASPADGFDSDVFRTQGGPTAAGAADSSTAADHIPIWDSAAGGGAPRPRRTSSVSGQPRRTSFAAAPAGSMTEWSAESIAAPSPPVRRTSVPGSGGEYEHAPDP